MVANPELVKRLKISKEIHELCDELIKDMENAKPESFEFITALYNWRQCQMDLQLLWGFKVDQSKWQEFKLPYCKCPQLDNLDVGYHMYFSADCPIHGDKIK